MRRVLALVLAYVTSRIVFGLLDFRYDPFGEPFHLGKLAIDLGGFLVIYLGFDALLGRVWPRGPGDAVEGRPPEDQPRS